MIHIELTLLRYTLLILEFGSTQKSNIMCFWVPHSLSGMSLLIRYRYSSGFRVCKLAFFMLVSGIAIGWFLGSCFNLLAICSSASHRSLLYVCPFFSISWSMHVASSKGRGLSCEGHEMGNAWFSPLPSTGRLREFVWER